MLLGIVRGSMPNLESLTIRETKCATVDLRSLENMPSRLTEICVDEKNIDEYYPPQMITGDTGTLGVARFVRMPTDDDVELSSRRINVKLLNVV